METLKNKKLKIIIVDDSKIFRTVLRNFLQKESHCSIITEASSGEEFLALNNVKSADIILMDLQMPGMDGYEVTKKAIERYPDIKVLAITMHTEKAYLNELMQVGFKGCVFKPEIYKNIQQALAYIIANENCFFGEINL
jgi:DNA-binding NarL/FixJ family response regulator